ncbi:hypothetical protein LC085_09015 [Bacillus tianshenii]|nr:hypothetical protein [Bacillus tianshenii]
MKRETAVCRWNGVHCSTS